MNRFIFFLSIAILFLMSGIAHSEVKNGQNDAPDLPNPYLRTYPFESAIIQYTSEVKYGHSEKEKKVYDGTETMYIKDQKQVYEIKMSAPAPEGKTRNEEKLQIVTADYLYYIDLVDKTGIKIGNSAMYGAEEYNKLSDQDKEAFHERMERRGIVSLDLLGLGKKTGTDKILGRECDVYERGEKPTDEKFMTAVQAEMPVPYYRKTWVWREAKIPLKIITEQMGSYSEVTATKIEENINIPDSRFEVPERIEVVYDEKASEASKGETLARFKLYKTGRAMTQRVKASPKEVLTPEGKWVPAESTDGKGEKPQKSPN